MKLEVVIELLFLFLIYSFVGWVLEVIAVAIKEKRFVNRGISNGPLCIIYGFGALLTTIALRDIDNVFVLFLGCVIYGTILEFIAGKVLEKVNKNKWWDYSKKKFNLDGYICLEYSLLWGVLGVLVIKVFNHLLSSLFNSVYLYITTAFVISALMIVCFDLLTSFVTLKNIKTNGLEKATDKFGNWILKSVEKRIENAYPNIKKKSKKNKHGHFAEGCNFYKLFIIFLIGAFLGDVIEIFFCRYSMDKWMSRSSVVWGQFSLVWGLAIALAALLLNRYQEKSNTFLFIFGSIIGGAYEYICSVFTEFFFGTIFWDYSKVPFNLNGRINLLFCFFWGFATIVFIKGIYPYLSKWIERIPNKIGKIMTNILVVFMVIDLIVTGCAMMRYNARVNNIEATNIVEKLCDEYFDDKFMIERWPNMKRVENGQIIKPT